MERDGRSWCCVEPDASSIVRGARPGRPRDGCYLVGSCCSKRGELVEVFEKIRYRRVCMARCLRRSKFCCMRQRRSWHFAGV